MNTSQLIYQNVKRRGYVTGWTPRQLLARQAVKLIEEAAELFFVFVWPAEFAGFALALEAVKIEARRLFDDRTIWKQTGGGNIVKMVSESADCRIVLAVIEGGATEEVKQAVSLDAEGLVKSGVDVGRGVRVDGTAAEKEV